MNHTCAMNHTCPETGPSHPQDREAPSAREILVDRLEVLGMSGVPSPRDLPCAFLAPQRTSPCTALEVERSRDMAEGGESKGGKQ